MKTLKFLIILMALTITGTLFAKVVVDKTYLKNLDGHKSENTHLVLPAGHSTITVEVEDKDAVISCQFINSNGIVGLEDKEVGKCWGNVSFNEDDSVTVKVINETDSYLEYRIHQITISDK